LFSFLVFFRIVLLSATATERINDDDDDDDDILPIANAAFCFAHILVFSKEWGIKAAARSATWIRQW